MFRAGLRMIIEADLADVEVFEAASLNEVVQGSLNVPSVAFVPDVVLLDLNLPDNNNMSACQGLNGITLLKEKWPNTPVLVLSSQDDQETVINVMAHGSTSFVSKAETAKVIVETIQQTLKQRSSQASARAPSPVQAQTLSLRQSEVLKLLSQGLSNKLIGRQLQLSENTVRVHVQALLKFFHATNRAEAAFAARQQSLVD
jgi:DNA-binding NarL/FixJ family response regulator